MKGEFDVSFSQVEAWDFHQVNEWLQSESLANYALNFRDNEIDGSVLLDLKDIDLKDMGINLLGHRVLIKNAIKSLRLKCIKSLAEKKFHHHDDYSKGKRQQQQQQNIIDQKDQFGIIDFVNNNKGSSNHPSSSFRNNEDPFVTP